MLMFSVVDEQVFNSKRHVEKSHRPAIMVGEIHKDRIIGAIGHRGVSQGPLPAPVARRSLIIKRIAYI